MDIKQANYGREQTVINNESGVVNIGTVQKYVGLKSPENEVPIREITSESQGKFIVGFVLMCAVPMIGFIADISALHPFLNFPLWYYVIAVVFIAVCTFIFFYDNYKICNVDAPSYPEFKHLHSDRLVSRVEGGYKIFTYACPCIYPNCSGKVYISESPERYNGNYHLYAKCSLAKEQHSYGLDCNLIAYPADIDWRPKEPTKENA
ncbi:hypothetical protein [Aliivibrio fischeri]|uniref:hypothetical protein n=1 Tax=Aliivibrio fischeri TaxID=668 RepID=UPI0012D90D40|nr:hypothetical protein [Aliivibrio fischeri]MUJ20606.1 hypothetical protein [Aliivibrio fischeri]